MTKTQFVCKMAAVSRRQVVGKGGVLKAMLRIAKTAAECSCSCDAGGRGKGYLGHDKGCWVHLDREDYKAVYRFIDSAKKRNS